MTKFLPQRFMMSVMMGKALDLGKMCISSSVPSDVSSHCGTQTYYTITITFIAYLPELFAVAILAI